MYVAARKQGVPARLVVYEDEHHNVGDPDRAIHRLEEVLAWYERHDPAVDALDATDPHDRASDDDNGGDDNGGDNSDNGDDDNGSDDNSDDDNGDDSPAKTVSE